MAPPRGVDLAGQLEATVLVLALAQLLNLLFKWRNVSIYSLHSFEITHFKYKQQLITYLI